METNDNSEARLSSAAVSDVRSAAMASRPAAAEAALIRLLLGKQRCNITFVVGTSENMRAVLGSVKRLLIQTLLTKASLRDSLFNIMTFSEKWSCWSQHMLPCAPDSVYMALSWIHSISCSPGRDFLPALTIALSDPACHAIHLLCAAAPDHPEFVLTALPTLTAGRPLNIFYLQDSSGQLDLEASDQLQCLTEATGGSCYVIPVGLDGALEKVTPLCVGENQSSVECCCPSTPVSVPRVTPSPLLRCSLGNHVRPVSSWSGHSLSPEFFTGCRVLARRDVDGFYYTGTVIQQVQGHGGVWVVDFDLPGSTGVGAVSSQRQLVCSLNMVNRTRAHTHRLVPGDVVLSPWEPDLGRYGPGRVMAATERRDGFTGGVVTILRVLMWNSCVSLVPGGLVLPVSLSQHDRIVRGLQITTPASTRCCSWLCARGSSSCSPQLFCSDCSSGANRRPYSSPPSWRSGCGAMEGLERAKQHIDVKRSAQDVPSSTSSSSSLSEDDSRVRLRHIEKRPPWRYWRRTGSEPQHRQPGSAETRRTSHPIRMSFPVPQISASPNHSSLFQSPSGAKGGRVNIRDVFGTPNFKPRPPAGLKPFSVHT